MNPLCARCSQGAHGETGHEALAFYVGGPYPGHHIFKCADCGERWIRHYGSVERFGWTRYALQLAGGIRQPSNRPRPGMRLAS